MEIAIIDDQSTSRLIVARLVQDLEAGLTVSEYRSGIAALEGFRRAQPDLVIVDYRMPGMTGIELIRTLRAKPEYVDLPIVMITVSDAISVRRDALEAGASDFLQRPIDPAECRARVRNLLRMRSQSILIKDRAKHLEHEVMQRVREIRDRDQDTILRLAKAGEYRDEDTGDHVLRISKYSNVIATQLGLPPEQCHCIEIAAPMHDIGKIGIPDEILLKKGAHTSDERRIMQTHTTIGYQILHDSPSAYLQVAARIAQGHHERWDGGGYPNRLAGSAIPLEARIVAVADVFDALVSRRPYKSPWSLEDTVAYMKGQAGAHFDPECLEAFFSRKQDVLEIFSQYRPC